jgi:diguanylate cyclase (GGDEF)-like protein
MARTTPERLARLRARYSGPAAPVVLLFGVDAIGSTSQYLHPSLFDEPGELTIYVVLHVMRLAVLALALSLPRLMGRLLVPVALFAVVSTIPVSTLHDETSDSGLWITVAVALGVVVATYVDTRPLLAFLAVASSCVLTVILIHDEPPAGYLTASLYAVTAAVLPALIVQRYRTLLIRARSEAERSARTDVLTGLPNRRGLAEDLPGLVRRAHRAGARLAVLVADLDHFKRVNDRLGHGAGDDVLAAAGAALGAAVRPGDVVARIGGEEFVVVLEVADPAGAAASAERLRGAVAAATGGRGVTVSIGGVVRPPPRSDEAETWLAGATAAADRLMYRSKQAGRDCVTMEAVVPAPRVESRGAGPAERAYRQRVTDADRDTAARDTAARDTAARDTADPTTDPSAEKPVEQWVTGDEPATGAQRSYLTTLAREADVDVPDELSKAEASRLIDDLRTRSERVDPA